MNRIFPQKSPNTREMLQCWMRKQFHLTVKNEASSKSKIEELTKYHNYHQ